MGPFGSLESRMATVRSAVATSTQLPLAPPLYRLAPCGAVYVHRSSATFMIKSRDAPSGSALDRRLSKLSSTLATVADPFRVSPSAAVSR